MSGNLSILRIKQEQFDAEPRSLAHVEIWDEELWGAYGAALAKVRDRVANPKKSFLSRQFTTPSESRRLLVIGSRMGAAEDSQVSMAQLVAFRESMNPKKKISSPLGRVAMFAEAPDVSVISDVSMAGAGSSADPVPLPVKPRIAPHKALIRIKTEFLDEKKDWEIKLSHIAVGATTARVGVRSLQNNAGGPFFTAPNRRTIQPVLGQRPNGEVAAAQTSGEGTFVCRSSLTSSLIRLARQEQGDNFVSFFSTPELPVAEHDLVGDEGSLVRSPSAPTVGALRDKGLAQLPKTMREQVASIVGAEGKLHPASDALMVNLSALQAKAEALSLALAKSNLPDSADYLDWLLTEFESPDDCLKEVRQLALKQEMAGQTVRILQNLIETMENLKQVVEISADDVSRALNARLDSCAEELRAKISQETYRNAFMFSDLTPAGESFAAVQMRISKAADDLIADLKAKLVNIERRYVTQSAFLESPVPSFGESGRYNEFQSGEPEVTQGPLGFYQWHLSFSCKQAQEKLDAMIAPVDDASPAVRFIEQTERHRNTARVLALVAPSLGVTVSERDILEMHRLVVPAGTSQAIVLRSRHVSDDSPQGLRIIDASLDTSIIDTALSADGYPSPVPADGSLDSVDLSVGTAAPSTLSEDHFENFSGKSLLQLAIDAGNYPAAFVVREHGGDFCKADRDGNVPKLNMVRISRKKVEIALEAYKKNRAHMVLSLNYQELHGLLDQAAALRMGDLMKVLLVNEGGMGKESMKTLVAHYLNIPGIDIGLRDSEFPSPSRMQKFIKSWCKNMIFLKLGVQAQGFDESSSVLENLLDNAFDHLNQPEYRALLDALFSMSALKAIVGRDHTDKKLAKTLHDKFGAYLTGDQRSLKAGPKTEVRQSLGQVLEVYKSKHGWSSRFKSNYRVAANLKNGSQSLSENLPLGDVLAIFHSKSGEFAVHSFKRLLAKELGIPGFESDQSYKDQKQALRLVDNWARALLIKQIFGDLASEAPPGGRNPAELSSQRLLNLMMDKAFGYFQDFNGSSKAREIFNGLAALDTSDIQAGFKDDQRMDQEISRLLQFQISKRSGVNAQEVRQPALARAFSVSRVCGRSDAASKILARHIDQESAAVSAAA